uniref:Clathrin light chain n=1 Tax=Strongyloides venezuelensis TaxID=75913 RepID=A0A0K0F1B1_STRVS
MDHVLVWEESIVSEKVVGSQIVSVLNQLEEENQIKGRERFTEQEKEFKAVEFCEDFGNAKMLKESQNVLTLNVHEDRKVNTAGLAIKNIMDPDSPDALKRVKKKLLMRCEDSEKSWCILMQVMLLLMH